jgi:aerobic carbon-monoxide dehydrogenase small subunit
MSQQITITLNGRAESLEVEDYETLLHVLREKLKLFGAREGCGQGVCGACTVLLDGQPASSCLLLAPLAGGHTITTIEGLALGDTLHPIQEAFTEHGALQCAYCTPGFVLSVKSLLDERPEATDDEIREYLAGNLCRCTGYVKILEAAREAASCLRSIAARTP